MGAVISAGIVAVPVDAVRVGIERGGRKRGIADRAWERLVSCHVMENALNQAEMVPADYFRYLPIVEEARMLRGLPIDGMDAHASVN
jgi:hypothetical protein